MISYVSENSKNKIDLLVDKAYEPYSKLYKIKEGTKGGSFQYKTVVFKEETSIVATLSYYIEDNVLRVFKVAVEPMFQGKGYFKKLLSFLVSECSDLHIKKLGLYTLKVTGAYKFFENCGFEVVNSNLAGFATSLDGSPIYELEMIKHI